MKSGTTIRAGFAALMLAWSGCATEPPAARFDEAGEVPGAWSATAEGRAGVDDRWVGRFGGRRLEHLVAEAYAANRDLRAAAARVERAAAVARGTGAAARPQLDAAVDGTRDKRNFLGFPFGPGGSSEDPGGGTAAPPTALSSISNSYGARLNLSWEIDLWGRIRAGERAAMADVQAEGFRYRGARASLAAQIVRGWLLIAETREQIALAEEALETRGNVAELVRDRFERATGDERAGAAQLRLAETDEATARETLERRRGELDEALRQLEILLGRYPSAEVTAAARLPEIASFPPAGLPSELLRRRPDILVAERQLAAAGKRRDQARRAFYPSFSLTASGGQSTEQLRDIFDSDFGVWSIAGRAAQPILRGGELRARLDTRDAEEREALANLQQTVLDGFGEVETALAADRFLAARLSSIRRAHELAADGAEAAEEDFARGAGDVLTLLDAQTRRIDLAVQRLTLKRLRLDNRVTLHLALGGDYTI